MKVGSFESLSKEWNYMVEDKYIILGRYIGDEENVIVYDKYSIDGVEYNTKIIGSVPLFAGGKMKSITFGDYVDTSECTNMRNMFNNCNLLESIDFGKGFDTSNVTDMAGMFYNCSSLRSLDLTSFDTSKVTSMNLMFGNCHNLIKIKTIKPKWVINDTCDTTDIFDNCGTKSLIYVNTIDITDNKKEMYVYIYGDKDGEHHTLLKNSNGTYGGVWTDGYDGISSDTVISFLEFLGYEVFEVIHNSKNIPNYLKLEV